MATPHNPSHLFARRKKTKTDTDTPCPACYAPAPHGDYCSREHELAHARLVPR